MRRVSVLIASVIVIAAACSRVPATTAGPSSTIAPTPPSPATSPGTEPAGNRPLVATNWTVESVSDPSGTTEVPPGVTATLGFSSDTQIRWTACNQYGGTVTVTPTTITMRQIQSTLMACPGPGTDVEAAMGAVLAGTLDYQIDGAVLQLRNGGRGVVLRADSAENTPRATTAPPAG